MVDGSGVPLCLVASAANVNDLNLLAGTVNSRGLEPAAGIEQHLCLHLGYQCKMITPWAEAKGFIVHLSKGKPMVMEPGKKSRRWVVERTASWLNGYRKLLVRFEKKTDNYQALLHLACVLMCWRRVVPIYG
jgi:putative transposase